MLTSTSHRKIQQIRLLDLTSSNSILSCLLVLVCILSTCLAQNETVTQSTPLPPVIQYCKREKMPIEVNFDGCNSTTIEIPLCTGMCGSVTKITASPPYSKQECQCCTSGSHRIRIRRPIFDCNGVKERKKIYLAIAEKCTCVQCGANLGG